MLGREYYFREVCLETDESIAGDFDILFIDSKVEVGLLAGEL